MTVIGVLLIVVATLILVMALLGGSGQEVTLALGPLGVSMSSEAVFLLGAATVLILVAGLELLRSGLRRSLRRRRELKQARAVVAEHDRGDAAGGTSPSPRAADPRPPEEPPTGSGPPPPPEPGR